MDLLRREVHSIALAGTVLALALTPRNAAALTALLAMCAWTLLAIALRWRSIATPSRENVATLALLALPVGWLLARAATSVSPTISLVGNIGQHVGAFTWVAALALFAATLVTSEPGDAGRLARALAVAGAVLAVATLLDAAGAFGSRTFSDEASGIVENSISLSQALLVALGAALAWAQARRRHHREFLLAGAAALTIALGMLASRATSAGVGVAAGLVALAAAALLGGSAARRRRFVTVAVATTVSIAGIALLWAVLGDGVQAGVESRLAGLSNDRFTIWTSAIASARGDLIVGRGPELFSAWVRWGVGPGGGVETNATYDPHNLWLYWLLGGGAVGLALALLAGSVLFARLFEIRSWPHLLSAAGVLALLVAALFGWMSVVGLALAAALTGVLLAQTPNAQEDRGGASAPGASRAPGGASRAGIPIAAALAAAAVLLSTIGLTRLGEYEWARALEIKTLSATQLARLADESEDPAFASQAVSTATANGAEGVLQASYERVRPILERDSRWHVDAAFARFQAASVRSAEDPGEWAEAEAALRDGQRADGSSGLWPVLGALQAEALGRPADAASWASEALGKPLPDAVAERMRVLASE